MAFPGTYNFNYYRGDTYEFIVRPKNSNGTAFDLSTFTLSNFTIATERGPDGIQYEAEAVVDNVDDLVTCTILPGVGRDLDPGTYVYDVQISNSSETTVYTLLTGTVTVTDDITGANPVS